MHICITQPWWVYCHKSVEQAESTGHMSNDVSPATQLVVENLHQVNNKDTKTMNIWPFVQGIHQLHQSLVDSLRKGPAMWKVFSCHGTIIKVDSLHKGPAICEIFPYHGIFIKKNYNDVIMGAMASQITSLTIVYSTVYSGVDQRKHQSSASLAFVRGIHRWPVNSLHKWTVTRKMFPFDDISMRTHCHRTLLSWCCLVHSVGHLP